MPTTAYLDPSTAVEHLKSYSRSDGLSVAELMDSTTHGGLTYNDFLMLPGRIDFAYRLTSLLAVHCAFASLFSSPS